MNNQFKTDAKSMQTQHKINTTKHKIHTKATNNHTTVHRPHAIDNIGYINDEIHIPTFKAHSYETIPQREHASMTFFDDIKNFINDMYINGNYIQSRIFQAMHIINDTTSLRQKV